MKDRYTIVDKLAIIFIVLFSFYCLEPFFIWETFANGVFRNAFGIIPFRTIFGFGIVVLWICFYKKTVTKAKLWLCTSVLLVAFFTVCLAGGVESEVLSLAWLSYFVVIVYLLFPEKIQTQSYRIFVFIFAITLILPIIWYVLTHLGINIPYTRLESFEKIKVIRGKYYKLYPLAIQITSQWNPLYQEMHLCGIYDEAGRVGTVAGLILVSEKFKLKGNWKNIVIFTGALLSFSLAFYIIAIIYFVISCFQKRKFKNIVIVFCVFAAYFIFINMEFTDPNITIFQKRFEITSEGLSGDNRTNDQFNALMDDFYESGLYNVLFGKGSGAIGEIQADRNIDGSSYKCMIYNFGIIGFGISLVWLCYYSYYMAQKRGANKAQIFAILAVYIANMYQRPSVFYMGYMLIFFGGITIASEEKLENKQSITSEKAR